MASLREIKDRIGSVKSTLKITGAMKLVASSKLRKAQKAIETLRPYERTLSSILSSCYRPEEAAGAGKLCGIPARKTSASLRPPQSDDRVPPSNMSEGGHSFAGQDADAAFVATAASSGASGKAAVVLITSNSSLCGAFNANAVRKALEVLSGLPDADVYAVGRKGADALKKAGYPSLGDWSDLSGKPSFDRSSELASILSSKYDAGEYSGVLLVYNHFVSTSRQEVVVEPYLPFSIDAAPAASAAADAAPMGTSAAWHSDAASSCPAASSASADDFIVEPDPESVVSALIPKVLNLKIYASVLDSAAAEHAARTVAMQTASDNAEDILSELTLEYNKSRQQKITSELLDILGGKAQ